MTSIDVGLVGVYRVLHGANGLRHVLQDRKRFCRPTNLRDTNRRWIGGRHRISRPYSALAVYLLSYESLSLCRADVKSSIFAAVENASPLPA
jgi:hypothetical protein